MIQVDTSELIKEVEKKYPRELTICYQSVMIRKLEEKLKSMESELKIKESDGGADA